MDIQGLFSLSPGSDIRSHSQSKISSVFPNFQKEIPNLKVKINLTGFDRKIAPELLSERPCNRQTLIAFWHTQIFLLSAIYTEMSSVFIMSHNSKYYLAVYTSKNSQNAAYFSPIQATWAFSENNWKMP